MNSLRSKEKLVSGCIVALLATFMNLAIACDSMKSVGGGKSVGDLHNIGIYEYSSPVDAWVLVDSWHDPNADLFTVGPDDYVWTEPGWSNSILFINADPSAPPPDVGGGGGRWSSWRSWV